MLIMNHKGNYRSLVAVVGSVLILTNYYNKAIYLALIELGARPGKRFLIGTQINTNKCTNKLVNWRTFFICV